MVGEASAIVPTKSAVRSCIKRIISSWLNGRAWPWRHTPVRYHRLAEATLMLESTYADGNHHVVVGRSVCPSCASTTTTTTTTTNVPLPADAAAETIFGARRDQIVCRPRLNAKFTNPRESSNEMTNVRPSTSDVRPISTPADWPDPSAPPSPGPSALGPARMQPPSGKTFSSNQQPSARRADASQSF